MELMSIKKLEELSQKDTPVNLVLGGGGVRGVAHIALLEFLEEREVSIHSISGSSAGALVGALYSSGLNPQEILDFFKTTPIFRYTWLNPLKAGIFDSERYALVLENKVKSHFEELEIPLIITATNIEKNKAVYFNKGKMVRSLLASCAIPAVFSPVSIDGELYSDGGIADNFPVSPLLNLKQPMIGSYVNEPHPKTSRELNSILKVTNHSNSILLHAANAYKFDKTYSTIKFPVGNFGSFETKSIDLIYALSKDYLNTAADK